VDFALLGLWWIAVQTRADLRRHQTGAARMSYMVSLQFVVPGTAAMLAMVAPDIAEAWRISFAITCIAGVLSILFLAPTLNRNERLVRRLLFFCALPLYVFIAVIAVVPAILQQGQASITALQLEGFIFCVITFIGAQTAWAAAVAQLRGGDTAERAE
jgi:cytochrome bd-type quinol oxidase subunit 2